MTLIAFHAGPDRAEILTDTLAYTRVARHLSRTSKVMLLPHLDAALVMQGSTQLAGAWQQRAQSLPAGDFDEFSVLADTALPELWRELLDGLERRNADHGAEVTLANSIAFHIGYAPSAGRFKAFMYASDCDFDRVDVEGLHVMPSPLSVRPSAVELRRLERHFQANFDDSTPVAELRRLPPPTAPSTVEGWIALAKEVRADRALAHLYSGFKTYVGGDVIYTRLELGAASHRRVHTFNDTGAEFAEMMAGSLHPAGQLGACGCGSGEALVNCCLLHLAEQRCPCGSGKTFGACCRVAAEALSLEFA